MCGLCMQLVKRYNAPAEIKERENETDREWGELFLIWVENNT